MNLQRLKHRNFWIMLVGDAVLVSLAYMSAYIIRFDLDIPNSELRTFLYSVHWIILLKLTGFYYFDLYKGMWRYTSIHDLTNIVKACLATSAGIMLIILLTFGFHGISRSIFLIDAVMTFFFIGGSG